MNLANKNLTRQLDLLPLEVLGQEITIIGAGAVGGWTALGLAKMGFLNLTVLDFDKVEDENLNNQIYGVLDVGRPKADALRGIIKALTGHEINTVNDRWTGKAMPGVVVAAVDSMAVRKAIWEAHKGNPFTKLVIDPRMGAETALMYCMKPAEQDDAVTYEKSLYTDENALQEPCTRKATAYCALPLAGLVCAQVKSFVTGQPYTRIMQLDIPKGAMMAWPSK